MTPVSKYTIGLRYGIITGSLYFILLFCRYKFFATNPRYFVISAVISFFAILMMYLFTGIARRNELGGYASLKDIFTSIFIVILITELVYIIFNLIYFNIVDPSFWKNFQASTLTQLQKSQTPGEQIEQQMKSFKDMEIQTSPANLIKGYGISVVIDSVFGLIFAIILRKRNPAIQNIMENSK
jgi:Na+/H+-dicarboxylate symporter